MDIPSLHTVQTSFELLDQARAYEAKFDPSRGIQIIGAYLIFVFFYIGLMMSAKASAALSLPLTALSLCLICVSILLTNFYTGYTAEKWVLPGPVPAKSIGSLFDQACGQSQTFILHGPEAQISKAMVQHLEYNCPLSRSLERHMREAQVQPTPSTDMP